MNPEHPMRNLLLPPVVVLLTVGVMIVLDRQWPLTGDLPRYARWGGAALIVIGLGVSFRHARLFRRLGTNINTFREPGQLVTAGLFGRTRNPMYLGMLIGLAGTALALGSLSPWLGPIAFFLLAKCAYVPLEERAMTQKFGDAYLDYQRRVPRWWW